MQCCCLLKEGFSDGRHSNAMSTQHLQAVPVTRCYALLTGLKYSSHSTRPNISVVFHLDIECQSQIYQARNHNARQCNDGKPAKGGRLQYTIIGPTCLCVRQHANQRNNCPTFKKHSMLTDTTIISQTFRVRTSSWEIGYSGGALQGPTYPFLLLYIDICSLLQLTSNIKNIQIKFRI